MAAIKTAESAQKSKAQKKAAKAAAGRAKQIAAKAHTRDSLQALSKLAEVVDGQHRIVSQPPIVVPLRELDPAATASPPTSSSTTSTSSSAPTGRRCRATAATCSRSSRSSTWRARSSASAASARARSSSCSRGATSRTRCSSRSRRRRPRCSRTTCPKSRYQPGERVVQGQRMMQAASDIYLGWTKGVQADRYLYWRQLRDMKGSAVVESMTPSALAFYARQCGWTLARAHARSGDPVAIAAYLGKSDAFDAVDHRLLRALRRPERARLRGLRRGGQVRTAGGDRRRLTVMAPAVRIGERARVVQGRLQAPQRGSRFAQGECQQNDLQIRAR